MIRWYFFLPIAFSLNVFIPLLALGQKSEPVVSLNPDRLEVVLKPGEASTQTITVTNNTSQLLKFTTSVEDFGPAADRVSAVRLYGLETGPYSLKDYLKLDPTTSQFSLLPGEQATVPITISLPAEVVSGGLYGAVMVAIRPANESMGEAKVVTRLGSLVFVRVAGSVFESGQLREFGGWVDQDEKQLHFQLLFENQGEVYLNPYGFIVIHDWFGNEVAWQEIKPWFVLPHSFRQQDIVMPNNLGTGYYRAQVTLNRGYNNELDTTTVGIWSWSVEGVLGLGIVGVALAIGYNWLQTKWV